VTIASFGAPPEHVILILEHQIAFGFANCDAAASPGSELREPTMAMNLLIAPSLISGKRVE
jgi:hypothetical protein